MDTAEDNRDGLADITEAIDRFNQVSPRTYYNKLRSAREKATFTLMMKLAPAELLAIRKEFFAREDELNLEDFLYIIQLHLVKDMPAKEKHEFMSCMYEFYKEVDVNGDGNMEWSEHSEEFTTFIVQKANQLNKNNKLSSLSTYYDNSESLDASAAVRRPTEYSKLCALPTMNYFAGIIEHQNSVVVYNALNGKQMHTVKTYAPPLSICNIPEKNQLAITCSDMTMMLASTNDPVPSKMFQPLSVFPTDGSQMSLAWMSTNETLYSGSEGGSIHIWNLEEQKCTETLRAHKGMIMSLLALNTTNNLVSASMDATISVWDTYTNYELFKLRGHRKGIFSLSYNPDYRLLVSCGFDHDAMVWSPFVRSLVFRLKGHHASLIGCHCVENSPEIITADIEGVFKLWDVRNFQCVQSFSPSEGAAKSGKKVPTRLSCFFQTNLPSKNHMQKESDSRIFGGSKKLYIFDQRRVVHEATTDLTGIFWIAWNDESSVFLTASERNLIIWDGLLGSCTQRHFDICEDEITAVCLDDRKRKIVIGDVHGRINVYNPANGMLMKSCQDDVHETVVSLQYVNATRRFVAGYSNGLMRIYDESALDDCPLVRNFEEFNRHPELIDLKYSDVDNSVLSLGSSSSYVRMWDLTVGKCELEINAADSSEAISAISFLGEEKIIITSDTRGNCIFWGSRTSRWQGKRLGGFLNHTSYMCALEPKLKKKNDDEKDAPRRAFPSETEAEMIVYPEKYTGAPDNIATYQEALNNLIHKEATESEISWGRIAGASTFAYDSNSKNFYTGNDLGVLRKYSIKELMEVIEFVENSMNDDDNEDVPSNILFARAVSSFSSRDYTAALHPVFDAAVDYIFPDVYRSTPALPNRGISFCWHVQAHEERILTVKCISHGILTGSSDRMVRMWSFEGVPIGELLQNIPVGVRNSNWKMELDVVEIMDKEDAELNEIMQRVQELAQSDDLPDIKNMDFSGLEPGAQSAEFSRSELRQRIEKSSDILGLVFPIDKETDNSSNGGSSVISAMSSVVSNASLGQVSLKKGIMEALMEVKSMEASEKSERDPLTYAQERRQAQKMMAIAEKFDGKTGTSLPSIKKRITEKGKPKEMTDEEKDDMSIASMLSGSQQSKAENEKGAGETMPAIFKNVKDTEKLARTLNATQSLERLTLPTPETIKHKNFVQKKCEKFNSFNILEKCLQQNDSSSKLSTEEKKELLQKRQNFRNFRSFSQEMPLTSIEEKETSNA